MHKFVLLFVFAYTTLMVGFAMAKEKQTIIAVVVSSEQNAAELKLSPNHLNLIYWRKQRFWPKGLRIKPVNLKSQHPLRMQFSQTILGSTPKEQIDYWNGQYFNGILPPHSVDSEEAVLRYVSNTKGAIGYINACDVDNRVQALFWLNNGKINKTKPTIQCQ